MDRDTVIALAREAGVKPLLYDGKWAVEGLDAFAALVAAHERTRICTMLDDLQKKDVRHNYYGFIRNMIKEMK